MICQAFLCITAKGFHSSLNDYSLFRKFSRSTFTIVAVYVDDILLAGDDLFEISALKQFLDAQFRIKDLGEIYYFLGLEIVKQPQGFLISRHKFTLDLLTEFKCSAVSSIVSPLDPHVKLSAESGALIPDPSVYRKLVGKLNFLQHTRPDISFTIQHLSQFMSAPRVPHLEAGYHVLRYLAGTSELGIFLNNSADFSLKGYSDSDWASFSDSRNYVSGFVLPLGGCPISWKSKKQPTIALSSAEAEYRALRMLVAEISWLIRLLGELGVENLCPVEVYCDNQAVVHIARNPVFS